MDFISNKKTDELELKQKNQRVIFFKFELNQPQSIIILIFALMGLFLLPFFLEREVFGNLYVNLLEELPRYLSDPEYSAITYFYYQLTPIIANIIIYSIFFYLSLITFRKILQGSRGESSQESQIIPQDRIVRWFGLKLSHGQAIFIFSLSIIGIPFLILRIMGIGNPPSFMFYRNLLLIPSGQYSYHYDEFLFNNAHFILDGLFFILCLYSIFATTRRKNSNSNQLKTASNYSILIFIVSLVIFLLNLIRLFSHLLIFTDLAYLIGATPYPTSGYQFGDFLNVIIILIISLTFLVFSYFLKKRTKKVQKEKKPLTWFHLNLTRNRFIMLLSYIIMYPSLLIYNFTTEFFTYGLPANEGDMIPLYSIIFLLILYSFFKISNKNAFHGVITQFNDAEDFKTKWLNFEVNRLQSVILGSISSGAMFFYIFVMFGFRSLFYLLFPVDFLVFVQLIFVLGFFSFLLIFSFYTIKCTYKAVKSRRVLVL